MLNDIMAYPDDMLDPDDIPRPLVAFGVSMVTTGVELARHRHGKAQLLLTLRGVLTCEADGGLWIVPPQCAVWIPGGAMHSIKFSGTIEGYNAFIDPALAVGLPTGCCTVAVTPLLRELLVCAARFPALYPEGGRESHLATLLIDEIAAAPVERLHLPMPADQRLRRIVEMMMAAPSDRGTAEIWARRVGLSERTLARLLARETGMSFGRWRQQMAILLALQALAKGAPIKQVAADLGYESAGSFVTMFRKALGTSPGRYMSRVRGESIPGE
ncbi:helix-turn-helix transcriptional regulator [Sphingomonas sp. QA11]|uniref:AraC family transcriptional regulator n=1 Tax=Sphingomonas sp. QA11 TaxID=2950605 RepID=UPI00234B06FF|nr:helix-turn-helix transcriptional regulator [Sphingomonas sp. QA11]WCM29291.1 helix-turn-helix transcriptional regulator [Sphingomonas sp. QA11]